MKKRAFGDLEQSILNILRSGHKKTVKQVLELLGSEDKYTTVMTVMSRLADKKILGRERNGQRYEYWLLQEKESKQSILQRIRNKLFGMRTAEVVSYLISEPDELSTEELDEIEQMVAEAKRKKKES